MKTNLFPFVIALTFLLSCKKDSSTPTSTTNNNGGGNGGGSNTPAIMGVYRGTVLIYAGTTPNPPYFSSLNNHTMIFTDIGNGKAAITTGNVIMTNVGTITGNKFTIPTTIAATSGQSVVTEWGTATLDGTNLTIDFNQSNSVGSYGKWTGTLVKQ